MYKSGYHEVYDVEISKEKVNIVRKICVVSGAVGVVSPLDLPEEFEAVFLFWVSV